MIECKIRIIVIVHRLHKANYSIKTSHFLSHFCHISWCWVTIVFNFCYICIFSSYVCYIFVTSHNVESQLCLIFVKFVYFPLYLCHIFVTLKELSTLLTSYLAEECHILNFVKCDVTFNHEGALKNFPFKIYTEKSMQI